MVNGVVMVVPAEDLTAASPTKVHAGHSDKRLSDKDWIQIPNCDVLLWGVSDNRDYNPGFICNHLLMLPKSCEKDLLFASPPPAAT
jgi:hypothetical protein